MANKVLQLIQESGAKWVDFRFTDTKGKEQHVTYPLILLMKILLKTVKCSMVLQSLVGKVLKHLT